MADSSKGGKGSSCKEASIRAGVPIGQTSRAELWSNSYLPIGVDESMFASLLAIAQSVPYEWPSNLNADLEEFSSICIAGADAKSSNLVQRPKISLLLRDRAVWKKKGSNQMEMKVTRLGNLICPTLSVGVEGLKADEKYTFFMDMMPNGDNIYMNQSGSWLRSKATLSYPPPNLTSLIYVPPSAFKFGSDLMTSGVNFFSAMITTNDCAPAYINQIFVHNQQFYLPRYHIVRHFAKGEAASHQQEEACKNKPLAYLEHVGTYIIPGTEFITVPRCTNKQIISLKVATNPYAAFLRYI